MPESMGGAADSLEEVRGVRIDASPDDVDEALVAEAEEEEEKEKAKEEKAEKAEKEEEEEEEEKREPQEAQGAEKGEGNDGAAATAARGSSPPRRAATESKDDAHDFRRGPAFGERCFTARLRLKTTTTTTTTRRRRRRRKEDEDASGGNVKVSTALVGRSGDGQRREEGG